MYLDTFSLVHLSLALVQGLVLGLVLMHVFSGSENDKNAPSAQPDAPLSARHVIEPEIVDVESVFTDTDKARESTFLDEEFYELWRNAVATKRSKEEAWKNNLGALRNKQPRGWFC